MHGCFLFQHTLTRCLPLFLSLLTWAGTLTEIVQLLTELGLNVKRARISSDGGWFVDEFHVQEDANRKVSMGKDDWNRHT